MNFQNIEKCDIFKIAWKIHFSQNFKSLAFFEVGEPGLYRTALNLILNFTQNRFFFI